MIKTKTFTQLAKARKNLKDVGVSLSKSREALMNVNTVDLQQKIMKNYCLRSRRPL